MSPIVKSVLEKRGLTVSSLSELMYSDRSHISAVLNGRRRGNYTRRRIVEKLRLTKHECQLLGWLPGRGDN